MNKLKGILSNNKKADLTSFNKLHIVFVGLYFLQAILIIALSKEKSLPITTNYLAYDPLLSSGGQVVHSVGTSRLFDINLVWLLAGMLVLSAIGHVVFATVYKKQYQADLKKGSSLTRWVAYGVICSFVMVVVAFLSGVFDVSSLLLMISVGLFATAFGIVNDLWARGSKTMAWFASVNAIKAMIIPWLVILIYVWGTFIFGGNSINAFVYWIYLTVIVAQGLFIVLLNKHYKKQGKWANAVTTEQAFFVILFVLQTLVALQVFFGSLR